MQLVKRLPTVEEILQKIEPYDIYKLYLGNFEIGGSICSPWYKQSTPSFGVYQKDGKLYHADFADPDHHGDCWQLVQQLYNLDKHQCVEKVARDFGIIDDSNQYKEIVSQYVKPVMSQTRHSHIMVTAARWNKAHLQYWESYGISKEQLKEENVWPVHEWSLNRKKQYIAKDELCFCYRYPNGYKIYYPIRIKEHKWKSNISTATVENEQVIETNDRIVITKAKKCRMYLSRLIPGVINVQNESRSAFTPELIEKLKGKQVYVQYDSDSAGKKNSMLLTQELGYKHLNCPDYLLSEGIKDFSDWYRARQSDDEIIEFLKLKQII